MITQEEAAGEVSTNESLGTSFVDSDVHIEKISVRTSQGLFDSKLVKNSLGASAK